MHNIITSKGATLFSGTQLLLMFIGLSGISYAVSVPEIRFASLLIWVFMFIRKRIKIDIANKCVKNGPFSKWQKLPMDGHINIYQKVNQKSKKLDEHSLKLLWVTERETCRIYTPKSYDDAENIALYLADSWKCKVYKAHGKEWLKG